MRKNQKHLIYILASVMLMVSACSKESSNSGNGDTASVLEQKSTLQQVPSGSPIDEVTLNKAVIKTLENTGDFKWTNADLKTLWSALQYNDHSLAIGYAPANAGDISSKLGSINIATGTFRKVHDALIDFIVNEANKTASTPITWQQIVIEDDATLPILTVRLTDKNVLTALSNLKNVRYLEPIDFWPGDGNRSSSGCSGSTYGINTFDYTNITPAAKLPWNYNNITVPSAWSTAQGQGITVGVIDAGISSGQPLLGSSFNDGASSVGRTIQVDYTMGGSGYSTCTHGTSMCGAAVGPRNGQNATTGVAYKSNLYFIRAADDVVLDASVEITGVKNAMVRMGDRADVKVISMSMGTPFGSSVLKDGVDYAYNKGKLVLAAAGTSYSWTSWWGVIYPAAYSSCVAVTGVNESSSTCSDCHDGSQVLLTVPMERNGNTSRNSLSLAPSGVNPTYIGGSSIATSTTAGVAALVWSARPNMTRAQLLTCLTNTAQYYPTRNSSRGYGNINANAAVNYAISHY